MGRRRKNNSLDAFIGSVVIIFVVGAVVVNFVAENIEVFIGGGSALLFIFLFYKLISHQIGKTVEEREKKRSEMIRNQYLEGKRLENERREKEKAERARERALKKKERREAEKEREREKKRKEREKKEAAEKKAMEKKEEARLRAEQAKEKALLKEAKSKEKAEKAAKKEASSSLSMETFNLFNVVDTKITESKIIDSNLINLSREISMLHNNDKDYFYQLRVIKGMDLDMFLFSDNYASVLFSEGLRIVKEYLKDKEIYSQIEIKEIEQIVYRSGLYHDYEKANTAIKLIQDTSDWKTLHRILLIHTPEIDFADVSYELINERFPMYKKIITEKSFEDLKKVVQATSSQFFVELSQFEREAKENNFHEQALKAS